MVLYVLHTFSFFFFCFVIFLFFVLAIYTGSGASSKTNEWISMADRYLRDGFCATNCGPTNTEFCRFRLYNGEAVCMEIMRHEKKTKKMWKKTIRFS